MPHPPVTAETSRIHQRQQALHLAAAATVWTPWLDLSHTLQNATLITKSPPRVWASKTFWQDLIYAHHQLEEALSSVTLPSRPTLSISSCALDSFAAPVGPVAANWKYVFMKSGLCKSEEIGCAAPECAVLIQDEHAFKLISRPTLVNAGLSSTEGRLQRWNKYSRNVQWRCEQCATCCVERKVLPLRNVDSLVLSSKWAVQFEQNPRLHFWIISASLKRRASKVMTCA